MNRSSHIRKQTVLCAAIVLATAAAIAAGRDDEASAAGRSGRSLAKDLPSYSQLQAALTAVVTVCEVAFSGKERGDQWPGSRVIAAQKANTANAFSLDGLALSTANLYSAVQPGGSLFGLQESNPVDPSVAYRGPSQSYGKPNDPMVGRKIGGVNVFGGGLALYNKEGKIVGGLGVSGDTSCTDHIIAWKIRHALNLDNVPAGVSPTHDDNIIYDIAPDANGHAVSAGGFGHPQCDTNAVAIATNLPITHPIGPNP